MGGPSAAAPAGARPTAGIVHTRSPHTVSETADLLAGRVAAHDGRT